MITGHGDDGYQYPEIVANFSSNVYHQLNLSGLTQHLITHLHQIHHYPEPDAGSVRRLLAHHYAIDDACVGVTNGATEAIYLIAEAFRGSRTTIVAPVFCEYADACQIHQHQITHVFAWQNIPTDTELCWLCSPNNPTGDVYEPTQLLALVSSYPTTVFVVDQSYAAFALNGELVMNEVLCYPNLIVLHSMTKHFAIPGLRLGYWVTNCSLAARINALRMPWSVNSLAIAAGHYLLAHQASLLIDLTTLLAHTAQLQQDLSMLEGLRVHASKTHYFLVELTNGKTAAELKHYLAYQHRLLIRDGANFVGLNAHYFRVATQTIDQNKLLVNAIREWLTCVK